MDRAEVIKVGLDTLAQHKTEMVKKQELEYTRGTMAAESSSTKSAWSKSDENEEPIVSLTEIMSEEYVEQITETDSVLDPSIAQYGFNLSSILMDGSLDDHLIAVALQEQFDRENQLLTSPDGTLPDKIEFLSEPYRPFYDTDGEYGEEELERSDREDFNSNGDADTERSRCSVNKLGGGKTITTKHNAEACGRRNTEKVMQLPLNLQTGDMNSECLNSRVYNSLRQTCKSQRKHVARLKDKEGKAVSNQGIDPVARGIIYKWINSDNLFDQGDEPIATGKESIVLHGVAKIGTDDEQHFAIKVYRMNLVDFKNRAEYVQNDYRFKNPRRVLRVWAEKEFMNLNRMVRAGLRCPKPVMLRKHVMAMTLIGKDGNAAKKLKDVKWHSDEEKFSAFEQTKEMIIRMYKDCNLVHGDLSEFNILYEDEQAWFIDVSQAMDTTHPRSLYYLYRDITTVLNFFSRIACENLASETEFFNEITGLNMNTEENLQVQIETFESDNRCVQLRLDKSKPGDMDLRLYEDEVADDPKKADLAKPYN